MNNNQNSNVTEYEMLVSKMSEELRLTGTYSDELANEINAAIITTDYNLNRVAQVHNIKVLNVNELQDSLKLMLTQGDIFKILITKTGKEKGQGVGYLEDGTMVVVDDADMYINELQKVQVTSILQTNSGRIIFTKLAN